MSEVVDKMLQERLKTFIHKPVQLKLWWLWADLTLYALLVDIDLVGFGWKSNTR
jgi:hypothetical protein